MGYRQGIGFNLKYLGVTQLKDVIHFYIGCNLLIDGEHGHKLIGVVCDQCHLIHYRYNQYGTCSVSVVKPILRPLSSMVTQEDREAGRIYRNVIRKRDFYVDEAHAAKIAYLLSKHFDLFGLIESGQAIDATNL